MEGIYIYSIGLYGNWQVVTPPVLHPSPEKKKKKMSCLRQSPAEKKGSGCCKCKPVTHPKHRLASNYDVPPQTPPLLLNFCSLIISLLSHHLPSSICLIFIIIPFISCKLNCNSPQSVILYARKVSVHVIISLIN